MLLAKEAPDWMDAMAINKRPTGNSVEARERGWSVIARHRPKVRAEYCFRCWAIYCAFGGIASIYSWLFRCLDRKLKLTVDGRFRKSIIRPTSGAVETENSLRFNELRGFRQRVASVHRSLEGVERAVMFGSFDGSVFSVESGEKEVLTAACNAVEFASR